MSLNDGYSDQELIDGLTGPAIQAERFEYSLFRKYAYFIGSRPRKYALSEEDASDCYTEAFLAVVSQIKSKQFRGESSIKTYLSRIFRNKCVDQFRKNTTGKVSWIDEFPDLPDESKDVLRELYGQEAWLEVTESLSEIGQKCEELLLYSAKGYSPVELAETFGFKTPRSASTQRYKCLEKLKQLLIARNSGHSIL